MTIGELIKEKDYDYISVRRTIPKSMASEKEIEAAEKADRGEDEDNYPAVFWLSMFTGICRSENGKLLSLGGDNYSEEMGVLWQEEWEDMDHGIKNGLTIVTPGTWMDANGKEITEW